jgi:hypothetical protein
MQKLTQKYDDLRKEKIFFTKKIKDEFNKIKFKLQKTVNTTKKLINEKQARFITIFISVLRLLHSRYPRPAQHTASPRIFPSVTYAILF